ncbi:spermatogenesis-associated protein 5-like protein 1 [Plakobranchus ocellatus]|uniref:Spermatogenesis-associated protein 5-like protein 1 n=1 Tax=Plakobranchus ocellatus TaxID=259542 RepID=A0AAV4D0V9_9GAST|nr:spermatogenesis-associated protein 5-like protein 1 [Plakobranchus ocellatus]
MMNLSNRLVPSACMARDAFDISIIVILKHFNKFKTSKAYKTKLQQQCHKILINNYVTTSCTLSQIIKKSKLAAAYGISEIVIVKCNTGIESSIGETYLVTFKTIINIVSVKSADFFQLSHDQEQVHLGGLDRELHQLERLLEINNTAGLPSTQRTVGVLLHGPSGCGKTSLVKAISYSCAAALVSVEATDILKTEFGAGAEALRKIFLQAISLSLEGAVVLFLDELDMLCPQLSTASLGNRQLTNALLTEMDKLHNQCTPNLLVIAATNAISCINSSLRRPGRFDREILVNVPSQQQRLAILKAHTESMSLDSDISLQDLARMTTGYVGADLHALCQESLNQAYQRLPSNSDSLVQMSDFTDALYKVIPSLKKGLSCQVDLQPVLWNSIGGLDDVKAEIQQSIEWPLLHPDALRRMDLAATKGVLLYGPPGCCKTTLVRAAATSCHVTFLSLSGAQVYSPYVGESERIISEAFQKARALSPCILFFDEIDSLVGKRSTKSGQSRVQERILATMLNEMDGIGTRLDMKTDALKHTSESVERMANSECDTTDKGPLSNGVEGCEILDGIKVSEVDMSHVIVVGATNRPDMLDAAILRPGRLDRHIYVPPPDAEGRKAILNIQVSKMSSKDLDLDHISDHTEYFSGADLKNLCREAGLTAVRELSSQGQLNAESLCVRQHHFATALENVRPSLSKNLLQQYF